MRRAAIRSWAPVLALVICVAVSTHGIAHAETAEDARWSVDFGAVSLTEAFDQLTQITGIKIFTTTPLVQRISPKRYTNQTVEEILKDMLKQVNYAAVWQYSKGGIESVWILAFDREIAESPGGMSHVNTEGPIRPSRPRSAGLTRAHPSGQVSGSQRGESAIEPSSEPEEPEVSEADTSDSASPDLETEPTEELANAEENQAGDTQDEGEQ